MAENQKEIPYISFDLISYPINSKLDGSLKKGYIQFNGKIVKIEKGKNCKFSKVPYTC